MVHNKGKIKLKERRKRFKIHPYGYTLRLSVSNSIVESYKRAKLPLNKLPGITTYACVWRQKDCSEIYAFLPERCGLGATAHEMLHVVAFIMENVGAEFEEEVWAYHLEELTQMAAEFVHAKEPNKYLGKKKKEDEPHV